jgi:serine/threonine protein kinase
MDEEEIFLRAIEIDSSQEREAFLNTACGADHALRARVESLLQSHKHESFLNPPETVLTPEQSAIDLLVPEGSEVSYFGNYELLGVVARGGMGVVYQARQVNLDRIVALKMMLAGRLASPGEIQRFRTEAEAAARLDHPHIVPIHEVGEHNGLQYFSMTFVDGQSLAGKLDNGPLPPQDAAQLMEKIADAVDYAHEQGVIHRDLKPANILIDQDGQPRLTDFGLAKKIDVDQGLTGTGQILGSPGYMAPEQAEGNAQVGRAADIYAMGAVLYHLVTGRPPFQSDNPIDTMLQTIRTDVVAPRLLNPKVPRDLEALILKALSKNPQHRYANASELRDELRRFRSGEPVRTRHVKSWRKLIRADILPATSLPQICCLSGGAACLASVFAPAARFGPQSEQFSELIPGFIPLLLAPVIACLIYGAAEHYRTAFAATVLVALGSVVAWLQISGRISESKQHFHGLVKQGDSGWANFFGMASWNSAAWFLLAGGALLLIFGCLAGILRQRDRSEIPAPLTALQLTAAIGVLLLGLSVTIPLVRYRGSLFGDSYDFSASLLKESPGTSGLLLTMTCAGCVLVGKGLLRGLVAPAGVALIGITLFLFSSENAEKLVMPAGAIAVYGSACLLLAVAVRGGVRPESPGSLSETGSEMVPPDPARNAFLPSSLFWIQLILYLSQIDDFAGIVFLAASVAACVSLLESAGVLRSSDGKSKIAFGSVVIPSGLLLTCGVVVAYLNAIQETDLVVAGLTCGFLFCAGQATASPKPAVRWSLITILALFSLAAVVTDYSILREGLEKLSSGFVLLSLGMLQVWSARLLWTLSQPSMHSRRATFS